jgi:Flp pilus assembly protein TadG
MVRFLSTLLRDRRGAAAAFFAAGVIPLIGFIGMAVDATRGYMVRSQLVHALDAAALAGGRAIFNPDLEATIDRVFAANFPPGFMEATLAGPTFGVDVNGETLTVAASAQVPTTFMRILGFETIPVSAETEVRRSVRGLELALALDVTGSMRSGGRIDALREATQDLLDILFGSSETVENLWVSMVPYAVAVNVGAHRTGWLSGYNPADFAGTSWKGCVEARAAPFDQTDDVPATAPFTAYRYPADTDNVWPPINENNSAQNAGTGPNLGCGPAITSLTQSKTALETAITQLLPWHRGGTMGNLGLVWAWRTLSPSWRGLWGGDTPGGMPFNYDEPLMDKAVVIMTDGENQFFDNPPAGPSGSDYGGYGRLQWNRLNLATVSGGAGRAEIDQRLEATCTAMKAEGIRVYTITFQVTSATARSLFERCASRPEWYFNSPDNAALRQAFRTIGSELSNLRIAR